MNVNANGKISPEIVMNENEQINHISTNPECYSTRPKGKKKSKFFCCLASSTYDLKYLLKAGGNSARLYKSPDSVGFWFSVSTPLMQIRGGESTY